MAGGQAGTNPGGDILNAGTLTVSNAIVSGGNASSGGGIENEGELTLSNVTLTGNTATNSGGAVDSTGTLTVNDSTLTDNKAHDGGATFPPARGTLTVNNSTFSDNDVTNAGGAHRLSVRRGQHHGQHLHRAATLPMAGPSKIAPPSTIILASRQPVEQHRHHRRRARPRK